MLIAKKNYMQNDGIARLKGDDNERGGDQRQYIRSAGLRNNIAILYRKFGFRTQFFAYVVKDETRQEIRSMFPTSFSQTPNQKKNVLTAMAP